MLPKERKNKKYLASILSVVCLLASLLYTLPSAVYAFDITSTFTVSDTTAVSGDILSNVPGKGLTKATTPEDPNLFGVLEDEPLAVYHPTNAASNNRPVVTSGQAAVNVTNYNGTIEPGDYITSSPIAGKGMKSDSPGYVVGVAVSTVTPGNSVTYQGKTYTSGQVNVAVRIEYYEPSAHSSGAFLSAIGSAFTSNLLDPSKFTTVVRYMVAGIIAIVAFITGFFAFTRGIAKGIEAIGRNPLARASIQFSIIVQVVLTLIVTFGALMLSFFILRG